MRARSPAFRCLPRRGTASKVTTPTKPRLPDSLACQLETSLDYYSTLGLYGDNGEENENYYTKKKMETTVTYWGYAGDNAEENANNHRLLGLYGESFQRY